MTRDRLPRNVGKSVGPSPRSPTSTLVTGALKCLNPERQIDQRNGNFGDALRDSGTPGRVIGVMEHGAAGLSAAEPHSVRVAIPDSLHGKVAPGDVISLLATEWSWSTFSRGSTSEFSNAVLLSQDGGLRMDIRALLEGAWEPGLARMTPGLTVPTSQPYSNPIFDGTPLDYDGTETTTAQTLASAEVVDWVLVQLRSTPDASSTVSTVAALVNQYGQVRSPGDLFEPNFPGVPAGSYYVVILHRNHLAAMTVGPAALPGGFADRSTSTGYGSNAQASLGGGAYGLWAGDGNGDGSILADDRQAIWLPQVGQTGYLNGDFNLDGDVLADDRQPLWAPNVGRQSAVPGASLRPAGDVAEQ